MRVDWYLATSKGKPGKYLGSTNTSPKGVATLLAKGLKTGSKQAVIAFVHGVAGKVYGNWSAASNKVTIK